MSKPGFIYTHDEAALIVDVFENILDEWYHLAGW